VRGHLSGELTSNLRGCGITPLASSRGSPIPHCLVLHKLAGISRTTAEMSNHDFFMEDLSAVGVSLSSQMKPQGEAETQGTGQEDGVDACLSVFCRALGSRVKHA